ncbi:MAG: hypothetical protein ACI32W_08330 [Enterococcus faecalis]
MIDYFELYKTCLKVIVEKRPEQIQDFLKFMNNEYFVQESLVTGVTSSVLIEAIFEVLENLSEDGLIKASVTETKDGPVYFFNGITTAGYHYLASLESVSIADKVKALLKEDGLPMTPKSITKAIAQLTL